jgi:hypothetical protein
MAWLGEELPEQEQDGRTPFAPRCAKDVVEERLCQCRFNFPHLCRSKIPQAAGCGDQPAG